MFLYPTFALLIPILMNNFFAGCKTGGKGCAEFNPQGRVEADAESFETTWLCGCSGCHHDQGQSESECPMPYREEKAHDQNRSVVV